MEKKKEKEMMNNLEFKKREDNIVKDTKNLFRLKKEIDDNIIKSRLKKENEAIKVKIIRNFRNLFEQE